jgi:ABC-type amino acid transport system permease subunit
MAGLTIWALMVPQAMAYAGIAGVPVQNGLYVMPLAVVGYALFGTSRHLFVGPSATVATLSASAVAVAATSSTGSGEYVALTCALTLMVGVIYIVGSLARMGFVSRFFARPVLEGFIVGLGLYGAGTFAEIFRAGFHAVPKGEIEAADMLGLSPGQAFRHIELPQALGLTLPPSIGQAINLVKESSVLSVITLAELTKVAGTISSITFAVVTPYLTVALLYWAIVEALSRLGSYLEHRLAVKGY